MISKIKKYLLAREARKLDEKIARGFCWAMNMYYRKGQPIETLTGYVEQSLTMNDYTSFDDGIVEAIEIIESYETTSGT